MQTGRKILNLRRDRKISQQDLARACDITPSALSKIEAGINSPRAHVIWKLARKLGVTVEYLLDEVLPYPYAPYTYRQDLYERDVDPESKARMEVTLEEQAFIKALRECNQVSREVAMAIPETSVETLRMIHFLVHHSKIKDPPLSFQSRFEDMILNAENAEDVPPGPRKKRATKKTSKSSANKKSTKSTRKKSKRAKAGRR